MYDFETLVPRVGAGSEKWDTALADGMPEDAVPLSVADMEFRSAPEIIEELRNTAGFGLWGYTYGDKTFRQAVAGWMRRRHGWNADPDSIVNTAGVVPALFTAVRTFTQPGDRVIVQPPVYHPFFYAIQKNNRVVLENPLRCVNGRYEMDLEDLRAKAPLAKMMILCSPHNPVGRVWSREELEQVAEICFENNVLLFSDEIHGDLILPGHTFVPFGTLPAKYQANCLIGTAASKTFSLAGLGCSSIFIPDKGLRTAFEGGLDIDAAHFNSTFGVAATKAAYEKAEPWLDELLQVLQGNYQYLKGFLAEHLPAVTLAALEGTYLAWLDLSSFGMSDGALDEFLRREARLYLNSGVMFGTGGAGHVRLNLACPRLVLEKAMGRLLEAYEHKVQQAK